MVFGRFLEGASLLVFSFFPIGYAAHLWRARLLSGWNGALARLAEVTMCIATVVCVSEILGSLHAFRLAAVAPTFAVIGIAGSYAALQRSGRSLSTVVHQARESTYSVPPNTPRATLVGMVAVSVVGADWGARTVAAYHHGITSIDSLWYHLPFAARFVQQGTLLPIHYVDAGSATAFFPANSELFHALGIMFMSNDVLSPLINSGWAVMALLAGWCIGRPFGVAPVTLTGVSVLLATPGFVATQPGGAYDDIVGLALVLSCAALLVAAAAHDGPSRVFGQAVAALAAGVALGTKFTFIAPVAAFTVGIWILGRRGKRLFEGGIWLLLIALTGAFWYVRNWIEVGNPLPPLSIKFGPIKLASPVLTTPSSTVAHFLMSKSAWKQYFLPGLRLSFGPAWWALLTFAAAGLVLGVVRGPGRATKMVAWVGIATGVAFIVTPQYLALFGVPLYFVANVRYVDPALVLGLVMLPINGIVLERKLASWLLAAYVGVLAVTQLDGTIWPIDLLTQRFAPPVGRADSLLGLGLALILLSVVLIFRSRPVHWVKRPPAIALVAVAIAVLLTGFGVQQFYLRNRYSQSNPVPNFAESDHITGSRIAVSGALTQVQYALYGSSLNNYVQYVGRAAPHGGYFPITSCSLWRQTLNAGHYQYVVVSTGFVSKRSLVSTLPFSYLTWTREDSAAVLIRHATISATTSLGAPVQYVGFSLFRLRGKLNPSGCSSIRNVVPTQP